MLNIIVVLKYGNEIAFLNRMSSLDLAERIFEEGEGSPLMRFGIVNTSIKLDEINGDQFLTILMNSSDASKLPPAPNPAFALVWRSDKDDIANWPTYSVEDRDINIIGLGTYHQQGVGKIA